MNSELRSVTMTVDDWQETVNSVAFIEAYTETLIQNVDATQSDRDNARLFWNRLIRIKKLLVDGIYSAPVEPPRNYDTTYAEIMRLKDKNAALQAEVERLTPKPRNDDKQTKQLNQLAVRLQAAINSRQK